MHYLPRKWPESRQVGGVKSRIMPTCHGLADKVGQVGNLGYHFLPRQVGSVKSRIMPTCHGLADKVRQVGNIGYIFLLT